MNNMVYNVARKVKHKGQSVIMDIKARNYLLGVTKKEKREKIKIGFIVQVAEVWDKEADIYEEIKKRDNIQLEMYVVPQYDINSKATTDNYDNNYFLSKYPEARRAIDDNGNIIDLRSEELDYIFFQRPYDEYLPQQIRSTELVKFTKCCYVPYAFAGADVFNEGNTNSDFFRNMYFVFLESEYMRGLLKRKYKHNSKKGIQHFECLGYPALEPYLKLSKREHEYNIMWTPRWSYDSVLGGSHFLQYKDELFNISNKFPDSKVIFRPHPLMFDSFIDKKIMSKTEVEDYLDKINRCNIILDVNRPIYDALLDTDILITDYSSIIVMYFLTGRPIIYCPSQIVLNETYSKLQEGMYVADNWNEVEKYLKDIIERDFLEEQRQNIISEYFSDYYNASKRIVDRIVRDYFEETDVLS